jgi:hypothetical protein
MFCPETPKTSLRTFPILMFTCSKSFFYPISPSSGILQLKTPASQIAQLTDRFGWEIA